MKDLYYPIALSSKGRRAVVVGGGKVAERKVKLLLDAGIRVEVVAPVLTRRLNGLVTARRIRLRRRTVKALDMDHADIIVAATSNPAVNKSVSRWARGKGLLVNVVDQPKLSNFISPAVFRAARAVVSVSTQGKDPVFSRDLKNFIKDNWDEFISYRDRL